MTSGENSISEPQNLLIVQGRIPPGPLYKALALDTCDSDPPPLQKTYLRSFKSVNAPSWLVSSDGRALQRCYRSQGIESRQA